MQSPFLSAPRSSSKRQREDDDGPPESPTKRRLVTVTGVENQRGDDTRSVKSIATSVLQVSWGWVQNTMSSLKETAKTAKKRSNKKTKPSTDTNAYSTDPHFSQSRPMIELLDTPTTSKADQISNSLNNVVGDVIDLTKESSHDPPKATTPLEEEDNDDEDPLLLGDGRGGPSSRKMPGGFKEFRSRSSSIAGGATPFRPRDRSASAQPQPQPQPKPKAFEFTAPPTHRRPTLVTNPRPRDRAWFNAPLAGRVARDRGSVTPVRGGGWAGEVEGQRNGDSAAGSRSGSGTSTKYLGKPGGRAYGDSSQLGSKTDEFDDYTVKVSMAKRLMELSFGTSAKQQEKLSNSHGSYIPTLPTPKNAWKVRSATKVANIAKQKFRKHNVDISTIMRDLTFDELQAAIEANVKGLTKTKKVAPVVLPVEKARVVDMAFLDRNFKAVCAKEQVEARDLKSLRPSIWLNDEIVNFYGAMIQKRADNDMVLKDGKEVKKRDIHFFNSFFYSKLQSEGYEKSKLARWTKKIDIFSKDIVIFPVNLGLQHWVCGAINFKDKRIEYYDSYAKQPMESFYYHIREYLKKEHLDKKKKALDLDDWEDYWDGTSPQQRNGFDCGVFSCQTLEHRGRGLGDGEDEDAQDWFEFKQENMEYFRKLMVWEIKQQKLDDR